MSLRSKTASFIVVRMTTPFGWLALSAIALTINVAHGGSTRGEDKFAYDDRVFIIDLHIVQRV